MDNSAVSTVTAQDRPAVADSVSDSRQIAFLHHKLATLREELDDLRAEVAALREFERLRDVVVHRYETSEYEPVGSQTLDARDFVDPSDGFYFLEYDPAGTAYRWTGPGRFTRLRFHVDRTRPIRLRFHFYTLGMNSAEDRLAVDVDELAYVLMADEATGTYVAGPIAPRRQPGPTDAFLHVPVVFCPGDGGSGDTRLLGVALSRVDIEPV